MPTRRSFLKAGSSLLLYSAIDLKAASTFNNDNVELTILHTNDWHSRIDPFPDDDPKYPGKGGASRRASLIEEIRKEVKHVLLLDAGDVFQGTPYFNYYGGEPEFKLMSKMRYDAGTLGNHDFDNGIEGLFNKLPFADFPFVNCNYSFNDTLLENHIEKFIIKKFDRVKVGIIGVGIDLNGLVPKKNYEGIHYNNPIESANYHAKELKLYMGCDMVICLSHLGFEYQSYKVSDRMLAANSEHIDLIIGGHTHTFLEKPVIVSNSKGKPVIINQVGWAGLRIGRIDYSFSSRNNKENQGIARIKDFKKSIAI